MNPRVAGVACVSCTILAAAVIAVVVVQLRGSDGDDDNNGGLFQVVNFAPISPQPPTIGNTTSPDPPSVPELPPDRFPDPVSEPIPTTTWWTALLRANLSRTLSPMPYLVAVANATEGASAGLTVCLPTTNTTATSVRAACDVSLTLGTTGMLGLPVIANFSNVGVKLRFAVEPSAEKSHDDAMVEFPVVHGMPYATALYTHTIPTIQASAMVDHVDTTSPSFPVLHIGDQRWCVWTSLSSMTWQLSQGNTLQASTELTGWVRVAECAGNRQAILAAHAGAVVVGGSVTLGASKVRGQVVFNWQLSPLSTSSNVLMMALPHHLSVLNDPVLTTLTFPSVRGTMQGATGATWTLTTTLTSLPTSSSSSVLTPSSAVGAAMLEALYEAVFRDSTYDPGEIPAVHSPTPSTSRSPSSSPAPPSPSSSPPPAPSSSPSSSAPPSPSPSSSAPPSASASSSASASESASASASPSSSDTSTTSSPSTTPSTTPSTSSTPSTTPSGSESTSPSATVGTSLSSSASASASASASSSPSPTASSSLSPTHTPTPSVTPSSTPSSTLSATPSSSATASATSPPSPSTTPSPSRPPSSTASTTPSHSLSPSASTTSGLSPTPSPSPSPSTTPSAVADYALTGLEDSVVYEYARRLFTLARLVDVADALGMDELSLKMRVRLQSRLTPWLSEDSRLQYDAVWGGVVDRGANETYSDHHIAFGYLIYSAAIVARGNATWSERYQPAVLDLVRDICNPSDDDEFFPSTRAMDWYMGHSWASGVGSDVDHQSHFSVTEAINAWYGVYLYGDVIDNDQVREIGGLLLSTEITAARTYYYTLNSTVYSEPFASSGVVGSLTDVGSEITTEFGSVLDFAHLSQLLPFTPATAVVLEGVDLEAQFQTLSASYEGNWQALYLSSMALVDPEGAFDLTATLTDFSNATTLTDVLWWIATRQAALQPNTGTAVPSPSPYQPFTFPESLCANQDTEIAVKVKSAGGDQRNHAGFWFNDKAYLDTPTNRGVNILTLEASTLSLKRAASFDTSAEPAASEALLAELDSLSPDDVLLLAVQEDAAAHLTTSLVNALYADWGAMRAFAVGPRDSYALVARKGSPGSHAEAYTAAGGLASIAMSSLACTHTPVARSEQCVPATLQIAVAGAVATVVSNGDHVVPAQRASALVNLLRFNTHTNALEQVGSFDDSASVDAFVDDWVSSDPGTALVLLVRVGGAGAVSSFVRDVLSSEGSESAMALTAGHYYAAVVELGQAIYEQMGTCTDCANATPVRLNHTLACISPSPTPSITPSTTPSTSPSPSPPSKDDSANIGVIVGASVGTVFGAVLVCVLASRMRQGYQSGAAAPPGSPSKATALGTQATELGMEPKYLDNDQGL